MVTTNAEATAEAAVRTTEISNNPLPIDNNDILILDFASSIHQNLSYQN